MARSRVPKAKRGNAIAMFSLEMSKKQLAERFITNVSGINGQKIRFAKTLEDKDWVKLSGATSDLNDLAVNINDSARTVQEIRNYCRQLKNKDKLDAIFVDYLQLCRTMKRCSNRNEEVADMSRDFKLMGKEFDCPIILLCQLNRKTEEQGEPGLHNLRESGAIEQDADNVLFLHVEKKDEDEQDKQQTFETKLIIGKQRNGPTGYVYLKTYFNTFRYYDN